MKIDVTQLQHLMDRSNLGKDNTHTKTWCSDNIDYKIEHVMNKCFDLYLQLLMVKKFEVHPHARFKY